MHFLIYKDISKIILLILFMLAAIQNLYSFPLEVS